MVQRSCRIRTVDRPLKGYGSVPSRLRFCGGRASRPRGEVIDERIGGRWNGNKNISYRGTVACHEESGGRRRRASQCGLVPRDTQVRPRTRRGRRKQGPSIWHYFQFFRGCLCVSSVSGGKAKTVVYLLRSHGLPKKQNPKRCRRCRCKCVAQRSAAQHRQLMIASRPSSSSSRSRSRPRWAAPPAATAPRPTRAP